VIRPCIRETEDRAAINCLIDILVHRAQKQDAEGLPQWRHHDSFDHGMSTLLHLATDVLERINPSEEEHALRVLHNYQKLCSAMPFNLNHDEIIALYQRVHETLAVFLTGQQPVARLAFDIMLKYQRDSAAGDVPFNPRIIEQVIHYAHSEKDQYGSRTFFHACRLALKLSTDVELGGEESIFMQQRMISLLNELELYLGVPLTPPPSPSLMLALLDYVQRNPNLRQQLDRVINALKPSIGVGLHASAFYNHGHSDSIDHRRAQEQLRQVYRPSAQRQQVVHVAELNELGLQLPLGHRS